ncbi:MAG: LPP20 family lipoprotein [Flavobacteriales bacterium]|nr:LPP20 family lipoprotein [Flavobacteriales bacterium]MBL0126226.1 LPP20 family lipoprotein [Flavobacteriales bacterium]MCC6936874.1 LPP20 family lipoprotein [Flavobacteriales bacterium]
MTPRSLSILMTAAMLAVAVTGCKSKKKAAEAAPPPSGEVEVKVECSGPEFFTDNKVFRANALGESMDQATAKKKAMSNARADLAAAINTRVKAVVDNYVNSREMQNREEVGERYESLAREVVDQQLTGVKTICEKTMRVSATGNYKTYVAIELSAQELLSAYNERLSSDERLRVDYDYEKFKETFEKEMEQMKK